MRADKVVVATLSTWEELDAAEQAIRDDYLNVVGGMRAWNSGYNTELTPIAKRKIAAIRAKQEKLWKANPIQ